jgi:hypothetical protein
MKPTLTLFALIATLSSAQDKQHQSIFFAGYLKHLQPIVQTNEGLTSLLGYSREYTDRKWKIEPGINTYIDSYSLRSYTAFVDISHDTYAYKYFRPIMNLSLMYKGIGYNSDDMRVKLIPLVKFRIGGDTKLFANIVPVPPIENETNGFVAIEVGFKW